MKVKKSNDVSLPRIEILNKLKKKKSSKKAHKLDQHAVASYLRNVQVVPWTSQTEWDVTCEQFICDDYDRLMDKLLVWQARVPFLPVGVEVTLYLIQAMSFDLKCDPFNPAENLKARTLYSLALVRFLNHISHVATQAVGGIGLPMYQLAAHMSIPSWLVEMRHVATHGGSLPTLIPLQSAASFIKSWLQHNYWIPTGNTETRPVEMLALPQPQPNQSETADSSAAEQTDVEEDLVYQNACEVISAYVASRVYHLRGATRVKDPQILKFWPSHPKSLPTKTVMRGLKHSINLFLSKTSSIACSAIAAELIPLPQFYEEFSSVFTETKKAFRMVCTPVLKLLQRKKLMGSVCAELAKIHTTSAHDHDAENMQRWSAIWIKKMLLIMEKDGTDYCQDVASILPIAMKTPNQYSTIFLPRLLRMLKPELGTATVQKIKELGEIWTEPTYRSNGGVRNGKSANQLISLDHILEQERQKRFADDSSTFESNNFGLLDDRGPEFWRNIPFGHVFT